MKALLLGGSLAKLQYFGALAGYINALKKPGCKAQAAAALPLFLFEFLLIARSFVLSEEELLWATEFEFRRKLGKKGWYNRGFLKLKARLYYIKYFTLLKQGKYNGLCIFGGDMLAERAAILASRHLGIKVFFLDECIIPGSVAVDLRGTGYLNSVPRDYAFYTNINPVVTLQEGYDEGYVYVPFQDDFSSEISLHSPYVQNMKGFFEVLEAILPELKAQNLVFMTDCPPGFTIANPRIIPSNLPREKLVLGASCVLTINSDAGISGLFKAKRVVTFGNAFYSGFGFAKSAKSPRELLEILNSLDLWAVAPSDISKFLTYLQDVYCIPGWKPGETPTPEHLRAVARKILL